MRRVKELFVRQAIAQVNTPIHLVAIEVSAAYLSTISPMGASQSQFGITDETQAALISGELTTFSSAPVSGEVWVATFENGNNIGARKRIQSITNGVAVIDESVDFSFDANGTDKVRFSKFLCLAMSNQNVPFYFPDSSDNGSDYDVVYQKFPFALTPVGSSIDGEMMSMTVDVSNVNLLVGNLVQAVDGLRGNRVTHLTTFDTFINDPAYGRFDCLEENMYIDSVTISNKSVSFKLETRFNIMSLEIPLNSYNRNFCRWRFRSPQCGWVLIISGEVRLDTVGYPMAQANSCDHSLLGCNGCAAHKNTVRFGGFPSISAR